MEKRYYHLRLKVKTLLAKQLCTRFYFNKPLENQTNPSSPKYDVFLQIERDWNTSKKISRTRDNFIIFRLKFWPTKRQKLRAFKHHLKHQKS